MAWTTTNGWLRAQIERIFDLGTSPASGNVLVYNSTSKKFEPAGSTTSYTPTLTQITIGNGTVTGSYIQTGQLIHWQALITFGTTTSLGALPRIAVPTAASSTSPGPAMCVSAYAFDSSANSSFELRAVSSTTTDLILVVNGTTSAQSGNTPITSTLPFTWATGDTIQIGGVYIAA